MSLADLVMNRAGLALDKLAVRWFGWSFVTYAYAKRAGIPYTPTLLLVTVGARSGREREAVMPYHRDGERYVLVGSHGGLPTDPHWVGNIRLHPNASVIVGGRKIPVRGYVAAGDERGRLWNAITNRGGPYAHYQKLAHPRELPIVVLVPVS